LTSPTTDRASQAAPPGFPQSGTKTTNPASATLRAWTLRYSRETAAGLPWNITTTGHLPGLTGAKTFRIPGGLSGLADSKLTSVSSVTVSGGGVCLGGAGLGGDAVGAAVGAAVAAALAVAVGAAVGVAEGGARVAVGPLPAHAAASRTAKTDAVADRTVRVAELIVTLLRLAIRAVAPRG